MSPDEQLSRHDARISALEQRITSTEIKNAAGEVHIVNVENRLGKIELNINRLMMLVICIFIGGVADALFNFGG